MCSVRDHPHEFVTPSIDADAWAGQRFDGEVDGTMYLTFDDVDFGPCGWRVWYLPARVDGRGRLRRGRGAGRG
ncbi:hypothetical protein AB4144_23100, partial [Rhizobiaceae sp. 2RAB30]